MTDSPYAAIIDKLTTMLAESAEQHLVDALRNLAETTEDDGVALVLSILGDYAADNTSQAVSELAVVLGDVIEGKRNTLDLYQIAELSALDLSQLADIMQTADAEQLASLKGWAVGAGQAATKIGKVFGPVMLGALKEALA